MEHALLLLTISLSLLLFAPAQLKADDIPSHCTWTPCEGMTIKGTTSCSITYKLGTYVHKTKKDDCSWTNEKNLCCREGPNKKWSKCSPGYQNPEDICRREFGAYSLPTGKSKACDSSKAQYECAY